MEIGTIVNGVTSIRASILPLVVPLPRPETTARLRLGDSDPLIRFHSRSRAPLAPTTTRRIHPSSRSLSRHPQTAAFQPRSRMSRSSLATTICRFSSWTADRHASVWTTPTARKSSSTDANHSRHLSGMPRSPRTASSSSSLLHTQQDTMQTCRSSQRMDIIAGPPRRGSPLPRPSRSPSSSPSPVA